MVTTLPDFRKMDDDGVRTVLKEHSIGLTPDEARKAQGMVGRPLTRTEAVIWGIQGSEHCSYKSSRRFLSAFPTSGRHIILGPKEDAGIVAITDGPAGKRWGLVIGHESHNHPSQIVPFEGAATGIGGCVRDVLCMGARVIGCMDALRLGDQKTQETRAIAREVVRGIAGYGNPLGVPNLGGDTVFDASYNSNCLVNAVTVGIVREDHVIHSIVPEEAGRVGYDIILIGKPTDRSGFGGASFASATMEEGKREQNTGAVQEPNPFLERHLLASTYDLFDWLIAEGKLSQVSFKDLGAGGVVCATVEQVADRGFGAAIRLDDVHVALPDLPSDVIACAETQERFCWMCHPSLTQHIISHYNETWDLPSVAEGARASVIGKVTEGGRYVVHHKGEIVCDASALSITSGLRYERPTREKTVTRTEPALSCEGDRVTVQQKSFSIGEIFRAMLSHPSHGSKSPAFVHYDKNVIGNTIVEAGEADASVIAPLCDLDSYVHGEAKPAWQLPSGDEKAGVALSAGGNGRYGRISPYLQGVNAAVETMRNVSCVGAVPRALTDCLNYGNPEIPEELWALEQGVRGIADVAKAMRFDGEPAAIISGNVSLYNTTPESGAIDPTAIVACVGVLPDASRAITMQAVSPESVLILLGTIKNECGGSAYYDVLERLTGAPRDTLLGAHVPAPDFEMTRKELSCLQSLVNSRLIRSAHDVSEGGLLLALFEMLLPQRGIDRRLGIDVHLDVLSSDLRSDTLLFSETGTIVLEVAQENVPDVLARMQAAGCNGWVIGNMNASGRLRIARGKDQLFDAQFQELHALWQRALTDAWREPS